MDAETERHPITGEAAELVTGKVADWALACEASGGDGFPTPAHLADLERALEGSGPPGAVAAAVRAVRSYVAILVDVLGPEVPAYAVDIRQSALLRRLLAGRPALAEAPPRDGLQPWYELVEQPGPHSCTVGGVADLSSLLGDRKPGDDGLRVVVNRVPWDLAGDLDGGGWLVRWQGKGPLHAVRRAGDGWTIERLSDRA